MAGIALALAFHGGLGATTLYASPGGVDAGACVRAAPCSVQAAQRRVRELRQAGATDIDVALLDGVYRLLQPLRFGARDSGAAGHPVRWHAVPGAHPAWVGSLPVAGRREGALWVYDLPPGAAPSGVYMAGQRRQPERTAACPSCKVDEQGLSGLPPAIMRRLQPGALAVVHARWRDFRCRVVALGAGRVDLAQPCWGNTRLDSRNDWSVASPFGKYYRGVDGFERLAGAPAAPGSFTVDAARRVLRYRPRPGDPAQPPAVELPIAEQLLVLGGTREAPVHDLVFAGIAFAYAEWRKPLGDDGYVSLQAGYLVDGRGRGSLPDNGEGMTRIGSAVEVDAARDVAFDRDRFAHLAAAGIALAGGTHGAAVTRSRFSDLGGGAIFAGDTEAHPADARDKSSDILVADNRIDRVARTYRDNVAIMAGFVDGIDILHNTIGELPYSGISVGWGWNYEGAAPVQSAVHVAGNRIGRVMRELADGGGIYTQGASAPGTSCVARNAVDMRHGGEGNGIYLDEHSYDFDVERNVVLGAWISAWASWSGNLRIVDNWTDTAGKPHNEGPGKVWAPNFTALRALPVAALGVLRAAGVRAGAPAPALPVRIGVACPSQ